MFLRILLVAPPVASFFVSAFVVAQVNVTANCTMQNYFWTFNSIGQSPCLVAANMLATCFSESYTLAPLPSGSVYNGASQYYLDKCECSTVGYSLITACEVCQGLDPNTLTWSNYVGNCSLSPSSYPPSSTFPNPVPAGIRVPYWAVLDVPNNHWNVSGSYSVRNNPEYGPGMIIGIQNVSTSSTSASASSTASSATSSTTRFTARFTASSTSSHSGGHTGAIAGGVIGGIAIISVVLASIFFLRRRRSQAASARISTSQPMVNDRAIAQSSSVSPRTMRFYDPDDPTTFPGYQGSPRPLGIPPASQVPLSSHVGSGSMQADMQTSLPHAGGYHGLPMPSV